MASKFQFITELYRATLAELTGDYESWTGFLRAACYNYKCPFDEQVLIYAQRPNATAVLELEKWNKQFGRWVNTGATGIAVIDEAYGKGRLKHYLRLQRQMFRKAERELARAEYQRLLDAAQARGDIRLLLLLETLCATGIRVSELQNITVEAVRNGVAEIVLKGKIRTILLPTKLCRKLLKYAKKRNIRQGQIFLMKKGNRLSRKLIWSEMKKLCEAAKVARNKVFPHNLRGLFARTFYAACRDVVRLADVLGHSSIETTRIYLLSTAKESARQLDRLGLLSGWA